VLDGEDEDATSYPIFLNHREMFQSVDVEEPTSFPMYNVYDEGGSNVIEPTHDEDSIPYSIYAIYDDACMIVPELSMEDDNEGDEFVDKILYEGDSPHESHHYTVSSSESVGFLCDNPFHVDEITLHELENHLLVTEEKLYRCL